MAVNDELFDKYRKFYSRSGPFYSTKECDKKCREEMLCSLVTSRLSDKFQCQAIKRTMASFKNEIKSYSWWSYIWALEETS
jgi:hypothetical protein